MKNSTGTTLRNAPRKHSFRSVLILAAAFFSLAIPAQTVDAGPLSTTAQPPNEMFSASTADEQMPASPSMQETAAGGAQEGSASLPVAYIVVIYLGIILVAIGIEIFIAFLMIRFIFEIVLFPPWKIILSVSGINVLTIPGAVFVTEFLAQSNSIPHLVAVLLMEIAVVVLEALWYRRTLSLHTGNALLLSLITNTASYIFGVILFGF
jgi:hypothetical protein